MPLLKCSIDYVNANDGTTNTLMLSENMHATHWCYSNLDLDETADRKHNFGFVWHNEAPAEEEMLRRINGDNDNVLATNVGEMNERHAYPSSNHPSTVNVAFCDGHVTNLNDNVDFRVYAQLMTSNHKRSKLIVNETPDRKLPQPSDDEF